MEGFRHLEEAAKAVDELETAVAQASADIRGALRAQLRSWTGDDWQRPEIRTNIQRLKAKLAQVQEQIKETADAVERFVKAVSLMAEMASEIIGEGGAPHGL